MAKEMQQCGHPHENKINLAHWRLMVVFRRLWAPTGQSKNRLFHYVELVFGRKAWWPGSITQEWSVQIHYLRLTWMINNVPLYALFDESTPSHSRNSEAAYTSANFNHWTLERWCSSRSDYLKFNSWILQKNSCQTHLSRMTTMSVPGAKLHAALSSVSMSVCSEEAGTMFKVNSVATSKRVQCHGVFQWRERAQWGNFSRFIIQKILRHTKCMHVSMDGKKHSGKYISLPMRLCFDRLIISAHPWRVAEERVKNSRKTNVLSVTLSVHSKENKKASKKTSSSMKTHRSG